MFKLFKTFKSEEKSPTFGLPLSHKLFKLVFVLYKLKKGTPPEEIAKLINEDQSIEIGAITENIHDC